MLRLLVDVLANEPDVGHLFLVERLGVPGLKIFLHLRCSGAGMFLLSFVLIGRERNDLRDPTSSWAASRS